MEQRTEMGLGGGGEWSGPKAQSTVFSRIMRVTGLRSALERAEYLGLPAAESHSGNPKSELRVAMWSFLGASHPDWDCHFINGFGNFLTIVNS